VFGRDGSVLLVLSLTSVGEPLDGNGQDAAGPLKRAAAVVTATLGGRTP
jgi:hypothetical protein